MTFEITISKPSIQSVLAFFSAAAVSALLMLAILV